MQRWVIVKARGAGNKDKGEDKYKDKCEDKYKDKCQRNKTR